MNHIPDIVRGREPRPFRDWVIEAKALGFEIGSTPMSASTRCG